MPVNIQYEIRFLEEIKNSERDCDSKQHEPNIGMSIR